MRMELCESSEILQPARAGFIPLRARPGDKDGRSSLRGKTEPHRLPSRRAEPRRQASAGRAEQAGLVARSMPACAF